MNNKHYLAIRKWANTIAHVTRSKLSRSMCRRIFSKSKSVVNIDDYSHSLWMQLDLSEHMQRRIFWMGHYSEDVAMTIKAMLQPGMCFIDIGANVGEITLLAGKIVGPSGSVIAFEPVDVIANKLERHLRWNKLYWCRAERLALSDHLGETLIFASTGHNVTKDKNTGLASLYNLRYGDNPIQPVRLTTLDTYIEPKPPSRIDGIKIDIEGAELDCLRGAESTLRTYRPWLIVEVQARTSVAAGYNQTQILEFLSGLGYAFYKTGAHKLHPVSANSLGAIQNVLCLHHKRHAERLQAGTL